MIETCYWLNSTVWTFTQGSFPVRKRTGTLRIFRAREREPIWGPGGGAPSGSRGRAPGQGVREAKPPEAKGILLPKRANLSLSFKWNLNFAAICRKGPERRSGDQKKNRNGVPVRSGSKRTLRSQRDKQDRRRSSWQYLRAPTVTNLCQ